LSTSRTLASTNATNTCKKKLSTPGQPEILLLHDFRVIVGEADGGVGHQAEQRDPDVELA